VRSDNVIETINSGVVK